MEKKKKVLSKMGKWSFLRVETLSQKKKIRLNLNINRCMKSDEYQ